MKELNLTLNLKAPVIKTTDNIQPLTKSMKFILL